MVVIRRQMRNGLDDYDAKWCLRTNVAKIPDICLTVEAMILPSATLVTTSKQQRCHKKKVVFDIQSTAVSTMYANTQNIVTAIWHEAAHIKESHTANGILIFPINDNEP